MFRFRATYQRRRRLDTSLLFVLRRFDDKNVSQYNVLQIGADF
jgi:hypothetical protein